MKTAYFDCFSGISGNMALGALLHAGLPPEVLIEELKKLSLKGYRIEPTSSRRGFLAGIHVEITVEENQPRRNLEEILTLIDQSTLSPAVKEKSGKIFRLLGQAEAQVHGMEFSQVHLHEVGAVDAMVDIVGTIAGLEQLGIERIVASPVNVGSGTVRTEHGLLPVPAPATALLLQGKPTYAAGEAREWTTPTGAALLAGLVDAFGGQPEMVVTSIGYGLGSRKSSDRPNCLRVMIGEEVADTTDTCWLIETNIDDMTPELFGHVMERLLEAGALDVFFTPIQMKKGRPAVQIGLLAPEGREQHLQKLLFRETTAIGLRRSSVLREILDRKTIEVETKYGMVPVKIGLLEGTVVNTSPEYDACRRLAREKNLPLKEIMQAALEAARRER